MARLLKLQKSLSYDDDDEEQSESSEERPQGKDKEEQETKDEEEQETKDEVPDSENADDKVAADSKSAEPNQRTILSDDESESDQRAASSKSDDARTVQSEKTKQKETLESYHSRHGKVDNSPYKPSGPKGASSDGKTRVKRHTEGNLNGFVQGPSRPIEIFQQNEELNGTDRVAADGIASQDECDTLIKLIEVGVTRDLFIYLYTVFSEHYVI